MEMSTLDENFFSKTSSLRTLLADVLKHRSSTSSKADMSVEDLRRQGVVLISKLKQVNRVAQERVKGQREAVQEGKRRVDSLHLALQNLHYQMLHLKHEAAKCLDFKAVDQTISLIEEDEALGRLQEAGEDLIDSSDSHSLMLARLNMELEQRKELVAQRCSMTSEKDCVQGQIQAMKEHLAGLRPGLGSLLKATKPVQTALQSTFADRRVVIETARHLPEPLYLLFAQFQSYSETCRATPSFSLSVSIGGDIDAGKKTSKRIEEEQRAKFLRQDSDSDREGGEEEDSQQQRRKSKRRRTVTDEGQRKTMVLQAHPMNLTVTMTEKGCGSVEMLFRYLPLLNIVVMQATPTLQAQQVVSCSSLVSAGGILNDLLEDDDGKRPESAIASQIIKRLSLSSFEELAGDVGLAYRWIQRLAGLSVVDDGNQTLEGIVKAVRSRIDSRFALLQQLRALEQCEIPIRGDAAALFPARLSNRLVGFSRIKDPMTLSWVCLSGKSGLVKKTDLCYLAQLERKASDRTQLHAAVFISHNYPRVSPVFIVHIVSASSASASQSLSQFSALRTIEEEINIHFTDLISSSLDKVDILGLLMRRLQMCFDVLVESELSKPSELVFTEKRFLLPQGGRDHARPFWYNSQNQMFMIR